MGRDWKVGTTGDVLRTKNAVEDFIFLGIYSGDRMNEYTKRGYEQYARSLVEEVVPEVERRSIRAEPHRRFRVEHLLPPGRSHRPCLLGACQGRRLLPRQRLARRQLRGDRRDGHGPDLARLGIRAEPPAPVLLQRGSRRGVPGNAVAPSPAVPERRGGTGLPRQQAGPGGASVPERARLIGSTTPPFDRQRGRTENEHKVS